MPFDALPTDLAALSNLEILALAESRPGIVILLRLKAIMEMRIEAAKPPKAKRGTRTKASAETKFARENKAARVAAAKNTTVQYRYGTEWNGIANPTYECRFVALEAEHGAAKRIGNYDWFLVGKTF